MTSGCFSSGFSSPNREWFAALNGCKCKKCISKYVIRGQRRTGTEDYLQIPRAQGTRKMPPDEDRLKALVLQCLRGRFCCLPIQNRGTAHFHHICWSACASSVPHHVFPPLTQQATPIHRKTDVGLACVACSPPVSSAWFLSQCYLLGTYKLILNEPSQFLSRC